MLLTWRSSVRSTGRSLPATSRFDRLGHGSGPAARQSATRSTGHACWRPSTTAGPGYLASEYDPEYEVFGFWFRQPKLVAW